jgi:hypothetical protein
VSVLPDNGTLLRVDSPQPATAGGDVAGFTPGADLSVRVTIDEPTRAQQVRLGATIADVSLVVYALRDDLPAGTQVREGYRVVAAQDGDDVRTYVVVRRDFRVFDELTHFELFCKEVA